MKKCSKSFFCLVSSINIRRIVLTVSWVIDFCTLCVDLIIWISEICKKVRPIVSSRHFFSCWIWVQILFFSVLASGVFSWRVPRALLLRLFLWTPINRRVRLHLNIIGIHRRCVLNLWVMPLETVTRSRVIVQKMSTLDRTNLRFRIRSNYTMIYLGFIFSFLANAAKS